MPYYGRFTGYDDELWRKREDINTKLEQWDQTARYWQHSRESRRAPPDISREAYAIDALQLNKHVNELLVARKQILKVIVVDEATFVRRGISGAAMTRCDSMIMQKMKEEAWQNKRNQGEQY